MRSQDEGQVKLDDLVNIAFSSQDSDLRSQDEGPLIKGPGYCPLESRSRFEVSIRGIHQL